MGGVIAGALPVLFGIGAIVVGFALLLTGVGFLVLAYLGVLRRKEAATAAAERTAMPTT